MVDTASPARPPDREALGFFASLVFTAMAAVRDVYFAGVFQEVSPLLVGVVAFSLCSIVFLPIALVRSPASVGRLLRRPRELVGVNATTALAWIAFFYALRTTEPLLVQVLFSGIGPLTIVCLDGHDRSRGERVGHWGLMATMALAAAVVLAGLSGGPPQPFGFALLGVVLALFAGFSISVSTMLSRRLNDAGIDPTALVALRFLGATLMAAALTLPAGQRLAAVAARETILGVAGASLLLMVVPIYVNQVGIALASPLTVRVALAVGPVLIFVLQLVEGRLSSSPYSLTCAVLYGVVAITAAVLRRRAFSTIILPSEDRGRRASRHPAG